MVLCGMECVNLKTTSIKILRIHFSCNGKIENDENYSIYIIKIWYEYEKGGLKNVDISPKQQTSNVLESEDYMTPVFITGKRYLYSLLKITYRKISYFILA